MYAAVAQFTVVQIGFLSHFACLFGHACHLFANLFAFGHLLQDDVGHVGVLVQVVVHLALDEVADEFVYGNAAVGDGGERSELHLGLALEERLLDVDGDGGNETVTDVGEIVRFAGVVANDFGDIFFKCGLMGAAQCCVLSVDEAVVFLAVLFGVGEGDFNILAAQVDDGVEGLVVHAVVEQIGESFSGDDAASAQHDGQAGVQVGVVAQHRFHELVTEFVVLKERVVGLEENVSAVFFLSLFCNVAFEHTFLEDRAPNLAVAEGVGFKAVGQGVDGLQADTVQTDTLLESLGVIFATGVKHRHGVDQLAQGDAAPVVANGGALVVVDIYFDALSGVHLEFVDAVVNDLLEQHVDAVLCLAAVAQSANIHTGSGAHMLHIGEVTYILLTIGHGGRPLRCVFFLYYSVFFHALRRLCIVLLKTSQMPSPRVLSSNCGCTSAHLNPISSMVGSKSANISVTAPLS